jgi:hypothetical protein
MVSSGMLHRVALERIDVSKERSASFIRVTKIAELRTTLAVTSLVFLRSVRRLLVTASIPSSPILVTLLKEALKSSEISALTRAKRRNIPEDTILHSHRRENLKSYIETVFSKMPMLIVFCNLILFEICTSTFNTMCKHL